MLEQFSLLFLHGQLSFEHLLSFARQLQIEIVAPVAVCCFVYAVLWRSAVIREISLYGALLNSWGAEGDGQCDSILPDIGWFIIPLAVWINTLLFSVAITTPARLRGQQFNRSIRRIFMATMSPIYADGRSVALFCSY